LVCGEFSEIIERPEELSALRLNRHGRIFETAVRHFENFMYGAGPMASHHKDSIERATKKR